ncbi:DNA cytosine methyltransferase [Microbispora sp. ATCC PTA-5024]|uniref:DNA cytosine methyltransferase n=1 Tax=Microbispora sp. ATCC PTA-5024 TaxID=316330 RepID=UPI0003DDE63F|nr:DNA (cytosine-5-)-methyltransferase [Microbispora sp. ATCC PTA-5024]ETK36159.1 DNA-cytosine methyltransferase [Microbispora sp. ATCC PTA-5024]
MTDLTAVSLFAGIGGFDLALTRAGVRVVAAVEIDPAARSVLRRQFPDVTLFEDVREVTGHALRAAGFVPRRGIITAGWPCQGNSAAGRRGGLADPRSGLWRDVVRLLADTGAAWFIGENVTGLLGVNRGQDFAVVLDDLAKLGMGFCWRVLDARRFGVPQQRRRLVVVGRAGGDPRGPVEVLLEPEGRGGDSAPGGGGRPRPAALAAPGAGDDRGRVTPAPVALRGRSSGSQIEWGEPGDPAFTLRTPGGGSSYPMVATDVVRRHTPLECERLQGFPDGWTAGQDDRPRYRQLGNAVPVPMAEWVSRRLVAVDARLAAREGVAA